MLVESLNQSERDLVRIGAVKADRNFHGSF
jgi:hypothetical protein